MPPTSQIQLLFCFNVMCKGVYPTIMSMCMCVSTEVRRKCCDRSSGTGVTESYELPYGF